MFAHFQCFAFSLIRRIKRLGPWIVRRYTPTEVWLLQLWPDPDGIFSCFKCSWNTFVTRDRLASSTFDYFESLVAPLENAGLAQRSPYRQCSSHFFLARMWWTCQLTIMEAHQDFQRKVAVSI